MGAGSSPLARGLRGHGLARGGGCRIIPARAGFTRLGGCGRKTRWDHPRSRGVYLEEDSALVDFLGSSPLARGLRLGVAVLHQRHGIIPARAGFTQEALAEPVALRIIPARAGFTPATPSPAPTTPDHPRSRGVYPPTMGLAPSTSGSSPLARGLPTATSWPYEPRGIIPARAGFTDRVLVRVGCVRDHPRSRGVYSPPSRCHHGPRGSSPLARGLPHCLSLAPAPRRIIPARAGFTGSEMSAFMCVPDHPRSRGVYGT